jgi:hypothetical protein
MVLLLLVVLVGSDSLLVYVRAQETYICFTIQSVSPQSIVINSDVRMPAQNALIHKFLLWPCVSSKIAICLSLMKGSI